MRKILALTAALLCFSVIPQVASAALFTFSASNEGGTGAAEMEFSTLGPTTGLTVTLDNTSPTLLDDNSDVNSPGIVGFGFDALDPVPSLLTWQLTAYDADGDLQTIGASDSGLITVALGGAWQMGTTIAGVTLDFLPSTGGGVSGAIYNPSAVSGFGSTPNYFTTATLTLTFDGDFTLKQDGESPFVRMQNVGAGGEGSLKITGTLDDGQTGIAEIPEPTGIAVWALLSATGLGGIVARRRRKAQQSN